MKAELVKLVEEMKQQAQCVDQLGIGGRALRYFAKEFQAIADAEPEAVEPEWKWEDSGPFMSVGKWKEFEIHVWIQRDGTASYSIWFDGVEMLEDVYVQTKTLVELRELSADGFSVFFSALLRGEATFHSTMAAKAQREEKA